MRKHIFIPLFLSILTLLMLGEALPFSFHSEKHPHSLRINIQAEPEQQFRLQSTVLMPRGTRKTTLNTFGPKMVSQPVLEEDKVLFNERIQGKSMLSFYDSQNWKKLDRSNRNFLYIQSEYDDEVHGHLLPMFADELPSFRVDKLFRCADTLVSVELREDDAHIVVFSERGELWRIQESIDGGLSGEDNGVRYGYAIDRKNSHPVIIDMGSHQFCKIDQFTDPAVIVNNWSEDFYNLDQILNLLDHGLEIHDKRPPEPQDEL